MKTMKKLSLCITIAALIVTGRANAQHVNLGIKAGLNVYNVHNDNTTEYDSKTGFHVGLLGHIHLSKHMALQPEIVYSRQGAEYNAILPNTIYKLDYINVPVILQYMFENGFRIQAGPQIGFLVNAKSGTVDYKNNLKSVDFGLGAGLSYLHTASGLGVDARYNFGLSNINDVGTVKSTNNGFQLGLFYMIPHNGHNK
jgi:hypothetical protein